MFILKPLVMLLTCLRIDIRPDNTTQTPLTINSEVRISKRKQESKKTRKKRKKTRTKKVIKKKDSFLFFLFS